MRPILLQGSGLAAGLLHSYRSRSAVNADDELDPFTFWYYISMVVLLTLMAGLMSGLTLGLMSLDAVDLEILKRTGKSAQQASAAAIVPLLHSPHRLLVTLLLCNSFAAEALPLFLDRLADPITAVVVSVTVVLLFGEIIPQALCASYGLEIGAAAAPFVSALLVLTSPVSWPISKILDSVLGKHHTALFKRAQLKALVDIHAEGAVFGGQLTTDEVTIIKGALDLTGKTAAAGMTPLDLAFMLSTDAPLDDETREAILASGHSRIPVHRAGNRAHILGIVLVKELIQVVPGQRMVVGDLKIRSLPYLLARTPMYDMLKLFKIGRSHMAVLTQPTAAARAARAAAHAQALRDWYTDTSGSSSSESDDDDAVSVDKDLLIDWDSSELEPVGIITIEDVIEELLQFEIVDETDQFVDNLHETRVNAGNLSSGLPSHLKRILASRLALPRIGAASDFASLEQHSMNEELVTRHPLPVLSLSAKSGMLEAMTSGELVQEFQQHLTNGRTPDKPAASLPSTPSHAGDKHLTLPLIVEEQAAPPQQQAERRQVVLQQPALLAGPFSGAVATEKVDGHVATEKVDGHVVAEKASGHVAAEKASGTGEKASPARERKGPSAQSERAVAALDMQRSESGPAAVESKEDGAAGSPNPWSAAAGQTSRLSPHRAPHVAPKPPQLSKSTLSSVLALRLGSPSAGVLGAGSAPLGTRSASGTPRKGQEQLMLLQQHRQQAAAAQAQQRARVGLLRRSLNVKQGVQDQLDLIQPLLQSERGAANSNAAVNQENLNSGATGEPHVATTTAEPCDEASSSPAANDREN